MIEHDSAQRKDVKVWEDFKVCPYWRKIIVHKKYYVIALCGSESPDELPMPENDLGPRSNECPFYEKSKAYTIPQILDINIKDSLVPECRAYASKPGREGITELESIWDNEVEEFKREVDKLS